mmetsp:Transcript_18389/g.55467  ORF Transcript_18389/g.55467 Transcript_18389/m.55467 type:complete len:227 (-) Transcript_18389:467-1147(-)
MFSTSPARTTSSAAFPGRPPLGRRSARRSSCSRTSLVSRSPTPRPVWSAQGSPLPSSRSSRALRSYTSWHTLQPSKTRGLCSRPSLHGRSRRLCATRGTRLISWALSLLLIRGCASLPFCRSTHWACLARWPQCTWPCPPRREPSFSGCPLRKSPTTSSSLCGLRGLRSCIRTCSLSARRSWQRQRRMPLRTRTRDFPKKASRVVNRSDRSTCWASTRDDASLFVR